MNTVRSKSIVIRSATLEDAAAIKTLLRDVAGVWQAWWPDDAVERALRSAEDLAFVATREDRVVGFASVHDVGFRAYLSELVVAEIEQGTGVGTMLLDAAETRLADRGCPLIIADAYPPAEGFYTARGWGHPRSILISKEMNRS